VPARGETTLKLINITRVEANPALFQPPPDYVIVNDQDSVTLNLKRHISLELLLALTRLRNSVKITYRANK
jgi:hypothetical protein